MSNLRQLNYRKQLQNQYRKGSINESYYKQELKSLKNEKTKQSRLDNWIDTISRILYS